METLEPANINDAYVVKIVAHLAISHAELDQRVDRGKALYIASQRILSKDVWDLYSDFYEGAVIAYKKLGTQEN